MAPSEHRKGGDGADRDRAYVEDILDSARRIEAYAKGLTFVRFAAKDVVQDAVLRRLSVIGEAASCLSARYKKSNPRIPWKNVIGFRNLVVRRYWTVDLEIVWKIVEQDVPALVRHLELPSP
jgi:uncharacterized protein with HEPN domain